MDAATLDCFFTVSGENVVSKFLDADSIYPEWEQLSSNTPWMAAQINGGEEIYTMQSDFYRQGDDTCRRNRRAIPLCCACSIPTLLRANRDLATQWS